MSFLLLVPLESSVLEKYYSPDTPIAALKFGKLCTVVVHGQVIYYIREGRLWERLDGCVTAVETECTPIGLTWDWGGYTTAFKMLFPLERINPLVVLMENGQQSGYIPLPLYKFTYLMNCGAAFLLDGMSYTNNHGWENDIDGCLYHNDEPVDNTPESIQHVYASETTTVVRGYSDQLYIVQPGGHFEPF